MIKKMKNIANKETHRRFSGAGGNCICPDCGAKIPHTRGGRCLDQSCPKCGKRMYREGSFHHQQWLKKNKKK